MSMSKANNIPVIHKTEKFYSVDRSHSCYTLVCGFTAIEDVSLDDLKQIKTVLDSYLQKECPTSIKEIKNIRDEQKS